MNERGHKVYRVEQLCGPIEAPVEQLNQCLHPVSLKHIVSVLPKTAKDINNLDDIFENLAKILKFILVTYRYSLANFNQYWYILQLSHEMQVCLLPQVKKFDDLFQGILKKLIVIYDRYDLFLKVYAENLKPLLVW